jgi:hypothetical protein
MKRLALLAALGLAGCMDPHEPLSPDFGNSVRANIAAQLVNPEPNLDTARFETDSERIDNALRRYRTNRTYPPHGQSGTPLATDNNSMAPPGP